MKINVQSSAAVALLTLASYAAPTPASVPATGQVLIAPLKPQPLADALDAFARQSGLQVVYRPEMARGMQSRGAASGLAPADALTQLLTGTGLAFEFMNSRTVRIYSAGKAELDSQADKQPDAGGDRALPGSQSRLSLAADSAARTERARSLDMQPEATLAEVIVTAQKRDERLQDVPVPVTALRADSLLQNNQLRLQDYYTQVPGLTYTPVANGNTSLTIRGVTSGGLTNPTVGVTVDDIPFGAASVLVGGLLVPDFDPGELAQIEVLRGPQGTLYGASSLGGLLKFVTLDPSTERLSGRLQAGINTVRDGGNAGYNVRGSINIPVTDAVALRISGFDRQDAGYVDDVLTGQKDVNEVRVQGGHVSLLIRPTDDWSIKLAALVQHVKADGSPSVDVPTVGYPQTNGLGDLQQVRIAGSGWEKDTAQSYSAAIKGKLGVAELTSLTGYSIYSERNSLDYTYLVGPTMQRLFGVGGANFLNHYLTKKFSQELRLNIPINDKIEWLIGGFYTSERSVLGQDITAANPQSGAIVGTWSSARGTFHFEEYAALTDVTFHLTDRFDLQVGGRESHIRVPYDPFVQKGPRFGRTVIVPANTSAANAFTYLVTPSFKFTPDLMVYARFASGYRPGAPNTGVGVVQGVVPSSYAPDKTFVYEAGVKGDFFDHMLSIDASAYHVKWQDIQLAFFSAQTAQSYTSNAGGAKSNGVELSSELKPMPDLTLRGWVSYDDAEITAAFPKTSSISAAVGSRLPTTPSWSGNVGLDKQFVVTDELSAFVGGIWSYVGDRKGAFLATGKVRADFPSYSQLNLNAGIKTGEWLATLYANNVTDKRGVLNGGAGDFPPFHFNYVQPRTIGLNVARSF